MHQYHSRNKYTPFSLLCLLMLTALCTYLDHKLNINSYMNQLGPFLTIPGVFCVCLMYHICFACSVIIVKDNIDRQHGWLVEVLVCVCLAPEFQDPLPFRLDKLNSICDNSLVLDLNCCAFGPKMFFFQNGKFFWF